MLTNFSELLDSLLIIAGLALVIIGLVMFVRSKSSTDASSVEAFGIKLNVTHPSLILVLAGVGLMLAPRLLPGLPGKPGANPPTEPAIIAEAPQPPAAPSLDSSPTAAVTPQAPHQTSTVTRPAPPAQPAPTASQAASRPARSVTSSKPAPTPSPAPARSSVATPTRSSSTPVITSKPESSPSPPATITAAAPPTPVVAKPARPVLAYAALGLPINRDFWSGETQATYTRRMHNSVQQAGQNVLRMSTRTLNLDQAAFNRWWNESRDQPVSREYCASASAPRALVSARIETPTTSSHNESAYWPEFRLRLYHCGTHRVYRQQKSLSPLNTDEWPFSSELNGEIERFLRTYRGDLAE